MILQALVQDDYAMEVLRTLAWTIGIFSSIVFVALFGRLPIFRRTPIGWINRLLLEHIPAALVAIDGYLTGNRISRATIRLYKYLMYERHPVVMALFVLLQAGSEILFLPPALSFLPSWHKYLLVPALIATPYVTLYITYSTTAHHITGSTHPAALQRYPYDYTLYHPHQSCRTCHRPKPARSKHCPICRTCIERHDHHCVWVNNCVGLHNYGAFVALLVSISALLFYGSRTGYKILDTLLQERYVPVRLTMGSLSSKRWSTGLSWSQWLNRYGVIVAMNARLGAITLLATMTLPLALGFLAYHIYLIWAGCTTNETGKWTDLREDIWDALVWKARIRDMVAEYPGPLDERIVYDAEHHENPARRTGRRPNWPKMEEWWLVRTRGGAQPMRSVKSTPKRNIVHGQQSQGIGSSGLDANGVVGNSNGNSASVEHQQRSEPDDRWTRVKNMKEVDNLYDLGLVGNIKDTLFRSFRA